MHCFARYRNVVSGLLWMRSMLRWVAKGVSGRDSLAPSVTAKSSAHFLFGTAPLEWPRSLWNPKFYGQNIDNMGVRWCRFQGFLNLTFRLMPSSDDWAGWAAGTSRSLPHSVQAGVGNDRWRFLVRRRLAQALKRGTRIVAADAALKRRSSTWLKVFCRFRGHRYRQKAGRSTSHDCSSDDHARSG